MYKYNNNNIRPRFPLLLELNLQGHFNFIAHNHSNRWCFSIFEICLQKRSSSPQEQHLQNLGNKPQPRVCNNFDFFKVATLNLK